MPVVGGEADLEGGEGGGYGACGGELQPAHLKETVCAPHRISVRVNGKELPGGSVEGALFAASALRPNNDDLVRADVDRAPRKKVFDPRADAPRFVKKEVFLSLSVQ